jgi:hypothetical protein
MSGADWQQQAELEAEREQRTIEALARADRGQATHEDIEFLAGELGISIKQLEAA